MWSWAIRAEQQTVPVRCVEYLRQSSEPVKLEPGTTHPHSPFCKCIFPGNQADSRIYAAQWLQGRIRHCSGQCSCRGRGCICLVAPGWHLGQFAAKVNRFLSAFHCFSTSVVQVERTLSTPCSTRRNSHCIFSFFVWKNIRKLFLSLKWQFLRSCQFGKRKLFLCRKNMKVFVMTVETAQKLASGLIFCCNWRCFCVGNLFCSHLEEGLRLCVLNEQWVLERGRASNVWSSFEERDARPATLVRPSLPPL